MNNYFFNLSIIIFCTAPNFLKSIHKTTRCNVVHTLNDFMRKRLRFFHKHFFCSIYHILKVRNRLSRFFA